MENLSIEDMYKEYEELLKKKEELENDIIDTKQAIDEGKISYVDVVEYRNDIRQDKLDLEVINNKIKEIQEKLKTTPLIVEIVNEDGTSVSEGYPVNPLEEKWKQLYPSIPKPEYSQVCDGYSCIWCGRCPKGSDWKVPEEDLELWNNYQEEVREYNRIHNPKMYQLIMNNKK